MRKVILSMMVSADGYIEGPDCDINWHVWDDEMSEYMMGFFKTVDTFLYGRRSYELMIDYWPSETGEFADIMNETPKIVFSKTLDKATWNARVVKANIAEEIGRLKREAGKDMVLFAGAEIAAVFMKHNLIDEYRLIINPVALSQGKPLFSNDGIPKGEWLNFNFQNSRSFSCGNVLLCYKPE